MIMTKYTRCTKYAALMTVLVLLAGAIERVPNLFSWEQRTILRVDVEPLLTSTQIKQVDAAVKKYRISRPFAEKVVRYAHKYQKDTFPKAADILAIVGIESSWNPNAVSKLKSDPAIGLTQIRPKVWSSVVGEPYELDLVENQIKYGAEILHQKFKKTRSVKGAVIAYNVGYTAYVKKRYKLNYLNKYMAEVAIYKGGKA